jgi:hypothetical protein
MNLRFSADTAASIEECKSILEGIAEGTYQVGRYLDDLLDHDDRLQASRIRRSEGMKFYDSVRIARGEENEIQLIQMMMEIGPDHPTVQKNDPRQWVATSPFRRAYGPEHLSKPPTTIWLKRTAD